jgi:hypothetical protein
LLDDALTLAFSPVGSVLSVAQAVISATVRIAAAVRAIVRGALGGKSVKRTGTLSPCMMYALRLATQIGRKRKTGVRIVIAQSHSAGFAIGSAQDIGDHLETTRPGFLSC